MEVTGRPSADDIDAINSPLAQTMLESLPPSKARRLRDMFPTASDDALDLLKSLLQFNPNKRLTAEQALRHPYVAQFHNPEDEPNCNRKINIPIDDNQKFSIREYRNKLYSDIHKRKKELRKKVIQSHHNYYYQPGSNSGASGQQQQVLLEARPAAPAVDQLVGQAVGVDRDPPPEEGVDTLKRNGRCMMRHDRAQHILG